MHTRGSLLNIFLASCLLLATTVACGQRGPLYLPDKKAESPSQQKPATDEPEPSGEDSNDEER